MLEEKYKTWINLTFFFLTLRLSQHKRSVYKRCLYWMQTFSEVITFFLLKSPVWEMPVSYQEQHILEIVHTCIFSEVSYTVWHSNPLCWHSLQNYFSSEKTVLRFWGDGGVRGNAPKTSFFLCSTPPPVWCINFTCVSENQTKMITIYYGSGSLVVPSVCK